MGDNILKDSRFSKLVSDPRYRQIPKSERKVKVDKRFHSMFNNERFKVKYTIDKRGRPITKTSSEDLKRYYEMDSNSEDDEDDEEAEPKITTEDPEESFGKFVLRPQTDSEGEGEENDEEASTNENSDLKPGKLPSKIKEKLRNLEVDYIRGEGVLLSDSSSEESEEEEDEALEHAWGELDADAETTDEITPRLAVCNMDWDNIKAADLFVLFNSFLPPGGSIENVVIYPSEYGLKRIREEEMRGPIELTEEKVEGVKSDGEENDEGSKYHMEKLRKYQLNRLKYYYAVITFDSENTANKIYTECDGIEYESSAAKLDLRFIPNDTEFEQTPHDECRELPDVNKYKPRLFITTALQQAKVQLTWDSSNPHRSEVLKSAAGGNIDDENLRNYLACSSSEDEASDEEKPGPESDNEVEDTVDPISKYKMLLEEIENTEEKKKNRDVEMEITWGLGLKEKTAELVQKKLTKGNKLTPFEEIIEKQKQKKKERKLEKKKSREADAKSESDENYDSDDVPSDVDMNDPYFAEEFNNPEFKTAKNKKRTEKELTSVDDEADDKKQAELELLLSDDDTKVSHFSLKKIQKAENESKTKKKWKRKNKDKTNVESSVPDFNINVNDDRFSQLYTSHHFNIDPTDPNFKKTKAMDTLIEEKLKRRPKESEEYIEVESKKPKLDPSINLLVKSLKRKSEKR